MNSFRTYRVQMDAATHKTTSTALQAQTSARLEVLLIVWRIREALTALPSQSADPDLTIRQWNHGIARELVSHNLLKSLSVY